MTQTIAAAALILCAVVSVPARQKDTALPELIDVFVAGEGGYHCGGARDRCRRHLPRLPAALVPDRALIEPPAQASLIRLTAKTAGDRDGLLFANPASRARERMTVRLSYDEGLTWPVSRVIHEGPAAYSSLVLLPDSTIGVLFERGDRSPYERITLARLTL
jgi:hypothetical protein